MRTESEIRAMLTALRAEVGRWEIELENSDETSYSEYCENILNWERTKVSLLEWVLNDKR